MEKLTIQHIAPYLPYDVQFEDGVTGVMFTLDVDSLSQMLNDAEHLNTIRLVLRNISCLTKTIQHEGREFIPVVELLKTIIPTSYAFPKKKQSLTHGSENIKGYTLDVTFGEYVLRDPKGEEIYYNQWLLFQKLAEWHINFVGIPEGLYIDKNTLK